MRPASSEGTHRCAIDHHHAARLIHRAKMGSAARPGLYRDRDAAAHPAACHRFDAAYPRDTHQLGPQFIQADSDRPPVPHR